MSLPRNDAEGPEPVVACETTLSASMPWACGIFVPAYEQGWGMRVVVEARDVPQIEGQVERGLAVRRKKRRFSVGCW